MQKRKWTKERYEEMQAWRAQNSATATQTRTQFHLSSGYYSKLKERFEGPAQPLKKTRGTFQKKNLTYMDIPAATQPGSFVTVIRCQPNQLSEVLMGLK